MVRVAIGGLFAAWIVLMTRASADEDAHRFIELWGGSAEGIWSYDVTVHATVRTFTKDQQRLVPVGDHVLRQRFMQGSWRVDQIETNRFFRGQEPKTWEASPSDVQAFALEFSAQDVRFFSSQSNFGQFCSASDFNRAKLLVPQLYEFFRGDFYGQTFREMLLPRSNEADTSVDGGLVRLVIPPVTNPAILVNGARDWFEVVLDARKGHMPVRIKKSKDLSSDAHFVEIENDLTQVDGGLWVPTTSSVTVHSKAFTGGLSIPATVTLVEVDLAKSKFNDDIDPKVFELPFPPGTVVRDADQQENYVQSDGDKRDYEAYEELVRSRMGETRKERLDASPSRVRIVVIVAGFLGLAAVLMGLYFRFVRSTRVGGEDVK